MTPELRDRWIAALESGEYRKGKLRLAAQTEGEAWSYCCLGVLADVCGVLGDPVLDQGSGWAIRAVVDSDGLRWHGTLPYGEPDCPVSEEDQWHLVRLNDNVETFAPVVAKIRELFPDEVCS